MLKSLNRNTISIVIGMLVLIGVAVGVTFLYTAIAKHSVAIKEADTAIVALENKAEDLAVARKNTEDLHETITTVESSLITPETFVRFIESLETIARDAGVIFQATSAELPKSTKGRAVLNFELRGTYRNTVKFFVLLDRLPYAGIVEQLNMGPGNNAREATSSLRTTGRYVLFSFSQ